MAGIHPQHALSALEKSLAFFRPHHLELRRRLCWVIGTIALCSGLAYCFAEQLTAFCIAPLLAASPLTEKLIYTNLPEAFIAYLKIAFFTGLITSMPMTLYQSWAFVSPGLRSGEKKTTLAIVFWASLLFMAGACFAFFIVLPQLLAYFMSYASAGLEPLPKFSTYLHFVAKMVLSFGLSFEIPFLMIMAVKIGLTDANYFHRRRFYFYSTIIVLAFLLAGGDIVATLLLFFPLFLLYQAGRAGIFMFHQQRRGQ